jgi:hypothetical protein
VSKLAIYLIQKKTSQDIEHIKTFAFETKWKQLTEYEDNEINLNNRIMSWFWEVPFAASTFDVKT